MSGRVEAGTAAGVLLSRLGKALADVQRDSPGPAVAGSEGVRVDRFLSRLAASDAPITPESRRVLEVLCDKVDVGHKLYRSYDPDWRPSSSREALPEPAWPVLAAAFLVCASQPVGSGRDGCGWALKFINGALNSLDIWQADDGEAAALAQTAQMLADEMIAR